MAAKVYQFQPAGFSFERDKSDQYNLIPGEILRDYYSKVIHGSEVGPFVIKFYYNDDRPPLVIDDGIIVPMTDKEKSDLRRYGGEAFSDILLCHNFTIEKLTKIKKRLSDETDKASSDASFILHKKNVYQRHTDEGYDVITLKVGNGRISCGWYDCYQTDKLGLEMSAFMLYALGFVNAEDEKHKELWKVCHNILPHSSELKDISIVDRIILDGMRKLILPNQKPIVFESETLW
jgi:hypothetical protein